MLERMKSEGLQAVLGELDYVKSESPGSVAVRALLSQGGDPRDVFMSRGGRNRSCDCGILAVHKADWENE